MTLDLITPVPGTDTPQGDSPALLTAEHRAALAAVTHTVTPAQFLAVLTTHLGYEYGFWDRCGGTHHQHDCSGYQCWAANMLGLNYGCQSSFTIAQWCWDQGLIIGEDEARHTDGVFAFHGPNGGRGPSQAPNGSDGHIVACYVPSTGGTLEAMGHAYGVVRGAFDGRDWVAYSKIPGMNYAPPITLEQTMIVQQNHYDQNGQPRPIPVKDSGGHYVVARALPAADGSCVELRGGASLADDQPVSPGLRRYTPTDLNGAKVVAVARWNPNDGTVPGVFVQYSDGRGRPVRFS